MHGLAFRGGPERTFLCTCLAAIAGLSLAACSASAEAASAPTPTLTLTPTPWPTLAPVGTPRPTVEAGAEPSPTAGASGPQLLEQYRVEVQPDVTAIFPLEGKIEHPVRVEVIVLSGDFDPVVSIDNAEGDRLAYSDTGAVRQPEVIGQFLFPSDGFYELGISSAQGSGEAGVSIYQLDPAALEGGGAFTSMDEELRGSMVHPASFHTFRLPVERGQRFDLAAEAQTEGLDLLFELYSPDGVLLTAKDDNIGTDPYLWNFMPSQSGTYTVVVSNYGETIGDYVLRVSPSEGGEAAQIGTRAELEVQGEPRRSTWLVLEGRPGAGISVEARPVDPGIDLQVDLYDPYGNRVASVNQTGVGGTEDVTLVQFGFEGTYQIEFTTLNEGGTIEYYIRPISAQNIDEGGPIVPGGFGKSGEMEGPGTVYAYLFDASGGDLIGVDAHATSSTGLDLGFDLYAPDGTLLVSRDDVVGKNPVIDRLELPQAGRYVLALWNYGDTVGTYDIFVTSPGTPATPPP